MRHTARNLSVLGVGLGISSLIGWLLFRETRRNRLTSEGNGQITLGDNESEVPQIVLPMQPALGDDIVISSKTRTNIRHDDLTRIRDIGPKFAEALQAIGITRFDQFDQETPETLASKLASHVAVRPQRIRDNDWIGQARQLAQSAH